MCEKSMEKILNVANDNVYEPCTGLTGDVEVANTDWRIHAKMIYILKKHKFIIIKILK